MAQGDECGFSALFRWWPGLYNATQLHTINKTCAHTVHITAYVQ